MDTENETQRGSPGSNESTQREECFWCGNEGPHDGGGSDNHADGKNAADSLKRGDENKDEDCEGGVVEKSGANAETCRDFGIEEVDDHCSPEEREHGHRNDTHPETHPKVDIRETQNVSKEPVFEILVGAQFLEDHNADGKSSRIKNSQDGIVADFGDPREEDREHANGDGGDDCSEEGAEDAKGEDPRGDGDTGQEAVAQSGQFEWAAVQKYEGTRISIDEANDESRQERSLIEGNLKELAHEHGGGKSEGFV